MASIHTPVLHVPIKIYITVFLKQITFQYPKQVNSEAKMNTNVAYRSGKQVRRGSESAKMHQKSRNLEILIGAQD